MKRGQKRINEDARGSYNSKREHPRASSSSSLKSSVVLSSVLLSYPIFSSLILSSKENYSYYRLQFYLGAQIKICRCTMQDSTTA